MGKNVKKKLYFVLLIVFVSASLARTQNVKAHNPETMIVSYNTSTGILTVLISHTVSDPNSHYIALVVVQVNGSTVLTESYTNQSDVSNLQYLYNITANTNDRIQITATCNQGGSITICIIVGGGSCPQDGGDGIPGYLGLWVILGISVIVFLTVIHRKLRYNTT